MSLKFIKQAVLLIIFLCTSLIAQNGKIKVKITGFEEVIGNISIGLFSSPEGFPKKKDNSIGAEVEIKDSIVEYTFTDLENGEYAIAVYHDENNNGKLDRNWFGMPSEDYVFSNYATGSFGPPSFEDSKFELIDSLSIELNIQE